MVHWRREWQTIPVFLPQEPHVQMVRQIAITLEDEHPRSEGVRYCTGEEQRNSSRRNVEAGPKRKWCQVMVVSGGESKVQCCKEQYYMGTWNDRSMNQGKLDVIKQEMARLIIDIWRISELEWMGKGGFNSMTIISTTVGKNPLEEIE